MGVLRIVIVSIYGRIDGWVGVMPVLRIGVDGWMGGCNARFKDGFAKTGQIFRCPTNGKCLQIKNAYE